MVVRQTMIEPNGRRSGGFSLRRALEMQGVTTEEGMRGHLAFVFHALVINPLLDLTRYRVDPDHPNRVIKGMAVPYQG